MLSYSRKVHIFILTIVLFIASVMYAYHNWFFDPQRIVEKSDLRDRTFETKIEEVVSPKYKIKAYLFEDRTNPIIAMSFIFRNAGIAYDEPDKIGVSLMASALLDSGAGNLNGQEFKEELENKAIGMSFSANMDDFVGNMVTLREHSQRAYEMLRMALIDPRFEAEDIARVKARSLAAIKIQKERPSSILALEFAKELYGKHPYARNPLGDENSIGKIARTDLQKFVKGYLVRDNLIVGVAGDISQDELGKVLDDVFGGILQSGTSKDIADAKIDFDAREKTIERLGAQDISAFAAPGVERTDPDFYPLYVANYIFGGSGLSSRLSAAAREEKGLTYSIYSYLSLADKANLIMGGFSSTPDKFEEVKDILKNEWRKMRKGADKKELEDAKNYLVSSYNLRFSSISNIADIMAYIQKDDLGIDFLQKRNSYVESVTLDQVRKVSEKYFDEKKMIFVSIGNFSKKND